MRLFYDNLIDKAGVVVTPITEATGFPAYNVLNGQRSWIYRTLATVALEAIVFDLGSAKSVTSVILLDHTLTAGDSLIKLQGNASDSWGSPSFSQTLTWSADVISAVFASQSYRYWRVTFTKASSGVTRDIGRIFLGTYFEPVDTADHNGYERDTDDLSISSRSTGGQDYSEARSQSRVLKLSFDRSPDADKLGFVALADLCGKHTSFFLQVDPAGTGEMVELVYGKLADHPKWRVAAFDGTYYWSGQLQFKESL